MVANVSHNPELLNPDMALLDMKAPLTVGEGFIGCMVEGPGITLNSTSNEFSNALWGPCPLPSGSCKYFVISYVFAVEFLCSRDVIEYYRSRGIRTRPFYFLVTHRSPSPVPRAFDESLTPLCILYVYANEIR